MKINDVLEDLDNFDVEGAEGGSSTAIKNQTKQQIATKLPQMPKTNSRSKFSSWNTEEPKVNGKKNDMAGEVDTNFMDEVDELLLE